MLQSPPNNDSQHIIVRKVLPVISLSHQQPLMVVIGCLKLKSEINIYKEEEMNEQIIIKNFKKNVHAQADSQKITVL